MRFAELRRASICPGQCFGLASGWGLGTRVCEVLSSACMGWLRRGGVWAQVTRAPPLREAGSRSESPPKVDICGSIKQDLELLDRLPPEQAQCEPNCNAASKFASPT
jgi:hypothetical protein